MLHILQNAYCKICIFSKTILKHFSKKLKITTFISVEEAQNLGNKTKKTEKEKRKETKTQCSPQEQSIN